jgi:NitT/TauT family transport system permease protein
MSTADTVSISVANEHDGRFSAAQRERALVHSLQLMLLLALLAAWQWVPTISAARNFSPVFDPFFISSPEKVAQTLYNLATGTGSVSTSQFPTIWKPFRQSVVPAVLGTAIAVLIGALAGLICSNWYTLNRIVRPFVIVGNSLPRITLIPIIVIVFGANSTTSVIIGFTVVFFLVFWNAYEGGLSAPQEALENVRILGASRFQQLRCVRMPYSLVWTFAGLPNAISYGLAGIITAELFTGSSGLGQVLLYGVNQANANLTIAVTIVVGITAMLLIGAAELIKRRVLHWW